MVSCAGGEHCCRGFFLVSVNSGSRGQGGKMRWKCRSAGLLSRRIWLGCSRIPYNFLFVPLLKYSLERACKGSSISTRRCRLIVMIRTPWTRWRPPSAGESPIPSTPSHPFISQGKADAVPEQIGPYKITGIIGSVRHGYGLRGDPGAAQATRRTEGGQVRTGVRIGQTPIQLRGPDACQASASWDRRGLRSGYLYRQRPRTALLRDGVHPRKRVR